MISSRLVISASRPLLSKAVRSQCCTSSSSILLARFSPSFRGEHRAIAALVNVATTSPRRHFSYVAEQLQTILAREEQEEVDSGNDVLPDELNSLKGKLEESWTIQEDDGATTHLFLKKDSTKVQVSFHCQDTIDDDEDDMDDREDDEESANPIQFTVTVTKAGKTLVFACISEYGEVKIDGISTTIASSPDVIHANQGTLSKGEYQGPDFVELAEDLQEAFESFLADECGVDSDVAVFIAMYTDYKEQTQYMQFLKDAQSIIV